MNNLCFKKINSPVGYITLVANDTELRAVLWDKHSFDLSEALEKSNSIIEKTESQLKEYFAGRRIHFDIPLNPKGTDFQKSAWKELLNIPYGKHITYGQQAQSLGRPKAVRAIGAANGKNPISIIIPCHRVLGASGQLTGYAGGLDAKNFLLTLEKNPK